MGSSRQPPAPHEGEQPAPVRAKDGAQGATGGVKWNAGNVTIESSLVHLKEAGPTPQDRWFLYVDCLKEATAAVSLGVETVPPEALRALVQQFKDGVRLAASMGSAGSTTAVSVGNPDVVRVPTRRSKGKRHRANHEKMGGVAGAAARSYSQSHS